MTGRVLFTLTDGGRARFVEQFSQTADFVTVEEMDNSGALRELRRALRANPPVRTINSLGRRRHAVGREDYLRSAKEAFAARVAERVTVLVKGGGFEAVALVAPRRLLGALRRELGEAVPIAEVIGKDLTKTPDHELGAWLSGAPHTTGRQGAGA